MEGNVRQIKMTREEAINMNDGRQYILACPGVLAEIGLNKEAAKFRTVFGPFATMEEAESARGNLKTEGCEDCDKRGGMLIVPISRS